MDYRPLEITIISAKDLKDVNHFSKMDVYVTASLSGDPRSSQRSPTDKDGGTSPSWNFPVKFTINESMANQNSLILVFHLHSQRTLGDRDIGEVHVPIKELLDNQGGEKGEKFVSYQVRKPNGKAKGVLNISYKFGEKMTAPAPAPGPGYGYMANSGYGHSSKGDEPVTAYPAGTSAAYPPSSGYPPAGYPPQGGYQPHGGYPPAGYPPAGYAPPPQTGYGYPPAGPGYGYPPQQQGYGYPPVQKPPKKNKMGLGLGAGLLGGALGGMLLGDMVSDAAGYDGGFDDGGDFGF